MLKIIGIDPGTAITGWGIIEKINFQVINCLNAGSITTQSKQPLADRIETIYDQLQSLITQYQPHVLAVESLFFNTNAKTALLVGQARGAVLLAGKKNNLPIFEFTPLQVKIAVTGYGRAEKTQVQQMVKTLLKLKSVPKPDDVADALAVCLACAYSLK